MLNDMTGGTLGIKMNKRFAISFELDGNRRYDSLVLRLHQLSAVPVLPTQWLLLTSLTADEIRRDLQDHLDPADRLLVTQVTSMSYRNLINSDQFGRGAA
jgi:PIN domain nuclease of toxin-antitoxin system